MRPAPAFAGGRDVAAWYSRVSACQAVWPRAGHGEALSFVEKCLCMIRVYKYVCIIVLNKIALEWEQT